MRVMISIVIYLSVVIGGLIIIDQLMSLSVGSSPLIISLIAMYLAAFFVPGVTSMLQERTINSNKPPYLAPSEEMTWVMVISSVIGFLLNSSDFDDLAITVTVMIVILYRIIEHAKSSNSHMYAGIYAPSVVATIIFEFWCLAYLSTLDIVSKEQMGFFSFTIFGLTGVSLIVYGESTRNKNK